MKEPGPTSSVPVPAEAGGGEAIELSIMAPAHNERDNIEPLVAEIGSALLPLGIAFEVVIVDDGSTDDTLTQIQAAMNGRPWLRCLSLSHTPAGKGNGQSAAFAAGIRACRGRLIGTLDADRQNDPADYPAMLALLADTGADMVQGDRSHARKDNAVRRASSAVGRFVRRLILADVVRDTGCSLRIVKREFAVQLPLEFRGIHRFIPVMIKQLGGMVVQMQVNHRPRAAGQTKYGFGITQRAIPALIDCFAVRWMANRRRSIAAAEVAPLSPVGQGAAR